MSDFLDIIEDVVDHTPFLGNIAGVIKNDPPKDRLKKKLKRCCISAGVAAAFLGSPAIGAIVGAGTAIAGDSWDSIYKFIDGLDDNIAVAILAAADTVYPA